MFVAGPPCRWAKWGVQDKSVTLFTHLHLRKKQVWGSYAPQLGTTFLLFNFFLWLLCDRQLFCDFIFCFGVICWHQQLPHLLYGWQEKRSSGRKIGASTETFNYLFHGFYPSFLSPPIFFPCFCFIMTSFPPNTQHLWPPSHTLEVPAYHCAMPASFWILKVAIPRTEQLQENFRRLFIYANTMFLAHTLQGKYWIPHPGYGSKQNKKTTKV